MRTKHLATILILLALAVPASPAHAGGIVSVCDEAHLRAALSGGGTVTFSCSGTITLTAEITISTNTTLDGSGQAVIISGNHAVRVFTMNAGVTLSLNRLTVANGNAPGSSPGGGINSGGTLIVSNSAFSGNSTTYGGGGIYSGGTLTVRNSAFSGNSAGQGGGISGGGTMTVSNSTFSGNSAVGVGGGISNYGMLEVSHSTFSGNGAAYGGGINTNSGTVTVSNSTFSGNSATYGGAIRNLSPLTVTNSTFSENIAGRNGGGIENDSRATVSSSTFSGNSTHDGGGIYNGDGCTATVSNSTFLGNSASYRGGGIRSISNSTLTVSNSTFAGNGAADGGGIYNFNGAVTLMNTIVANSPTGSNCSGAIADGGGNLSYPDTTCPGINGDPLLGPLQNNVGLTETMALGPGSAAIDSASDAICAAAPVNNLDQRGIARPWGMHCDIGAVEQVPLKRIWLPTVRSW